MTEPIKYKSQIYDIIRAMEKYGGSFVKQLAVLFHHADHENRRILETSFSHYFQQYDEIAHLDASMQKKV